MSQAQFSRIVDELIRKGLDQDSAISQAAYLAAHPEPAVRYRTAADGSVVAVQG